MLKKVRFNGKYRLVKSILLIFVFIIVMSFIACKPEQEQVATPTFNPPAGTYTEAQSVTISCATTGAEIRYTIDGSTPTSTIGTLYSSAISVPSTTTIKAIAYKDGMDDSIVASATYTINIPANTVLPPSFNPPAGTYNSVQSVTISSATSGAEIRYTTDGSTPTSTIGTVYSGAFNVSSTKTIRAIAYKTGMNDSSVVSATYTINLPQVETPTFNPPAGTYNSVQSVTISCATTGAEIRYTIDGSTPTSTTGIEYSGAFTVPSSLTIKAIAYKTNMGDSEVATATYTLNLPQVETPTFSLPAGTYTSDQSIEILCNTADVDIRYTTDGSTPTSTIGIVYSGTFTVSSNSTIKAIAYKFGMSNSDVATITYIILSDILSVSGETFSQGYGSPDIFTHTISPFKIGRYEVTYGLWYEVYQWATSNYYTFANAGREGNDGTDGAPPTSAKFEPVTMVNWRDIIVWCNAYSEMKGYTAVYYTDSGFTTLLKTSTNTASINATAGSEDNPYVNWSANGYRLPTEGEWEYASRYRDGSDWTPPDYASGATAPYTDATATGLVAWYASNSSKTNDVGTKNPNELVIYDISGNVWEWCWDWHGGYPTTTQSNYKGLVSGSSRVFRGGSWISADEGLRVTRRNNNSPYNKYNYLGLRLARSGN